MLLYSPESIYQLDRSALSYDGLSEIELMQRAGRAAWDALIQRWPETRRISVFAGSGNNGGDAYVLALCAQAEAVEVEFFSRGDLHKQPASAAHFRTLWQQRGGVITPWDNQPISGDVLVDGLLGLGLDRDLDADWQHMLGEINRSGLPLLALDIPSGLNAATGIAQPLALQATLTVTFIAAKCGQFLADGPDYCGELQIAGLGLSQAIYQQVEASLQSNEAAVLPAKRKRNSHKHDFGHLLVIGGDQGMAGAVALAAHAALRSGAGLVSALVHPQTGAQSVFPAEVMLQGWDAIESKLAQASVVLVGPGLGDSKLASECLRLLQRVEIPLVVDASALTVDFLSGLQTRQLVITPHPGEAARLLSQTSSEVQADRIGSCRQLVERYPGVCLLKGSGTLVAEAGSTTRINLQGNAGLASAGMGDVLGGIIAAFIGQHMNPFDAASLAACVHALCAEYYCRDADETGLIASDIIDLIPQVMRQLRND